MAYTTINKHTDYFNTKLYSGNGSTNAITGVGFAPDFAWIKERTSTSTHVLGTTIQGTGKRLSSATSDAEASLANIFTSFDSDGFTHGADNGVNESGQTYASWNWKANGAGSSNTDGTINSTVSANTTAGFSIVSYTGNGSISTVGHGLSGIPDMITVKNRSTGSTNWRSIFPNMVLGGASNGADYNLNLKTTNPWNNGTEFNDTMPTSSVFTLGTSGDVNTNGDNYIAYCFKNIKGYSKIGSYTGNGNADGTFVYTGFKPAFIILKKTSDTANWMMYDNKREGYNVDNDHLKPNTNEAEGTSDDLDILSNGFKLRTSGSGENSGNFIYMAFGQSLVGSNNVPCTAR
jgi:hypothetical protein